MQRKMKNAAKARLVDVDDAEYWMHMNCMPDNGTWVVDYIDATVTVVGDVMFVEDVRDLGVRFNSVSGTFFAPTKITSLQGIPKTVGKELDLHGCEYLTRITEALPECPKLDFTHTQISSIKNLFEHIHHDIDKLSIDDTKIKSLVGIAEFSHHKVKILSFSGEQWKYGGLGLVQMEGLELFRPGTFPRDGFPEDNWVRAQNIISKYVGRPDMVFQCQSELLDAGLDDYAQL